MKYSEARDITRARRSYHQPVKMLELHNYRTGTSDKDVARPWREATRPVENVEGLVDQLLMDWFGEAANRSSLDEMIEGKYFKAILSFGEDAIPPLLRSLEREPNWAILLLDHLVPDGPAIPPDDEGDLGAMARCWTQWGHDKGLI